MGLNAKKAINLLSTMIIVFMLSTPNLHQVVRCHFELANSAKYDRSNPSTASRARGHRRVNARARSAIVSELVGRHSPPFRSAVPARRLVRAMRGLAPGIRCVDLRVANWPLAPHFGV